MEKSRSASDIVKSGGACSRRNRGFHGVPTRCWCGEGIDTFISKTHKNPFRRFYRCKIAMQRKGEAHLFKWVDEALAEEISLVEARQRTIEEDLEDMRKTEKSEDDGASQNNGCLGEDMRKTEKSEDDGASQNNGCLGVITWFCCKLW
ncbi:hypothetical protein Bca52824_015656 [Brassica carinata]|uniref:GRF-type domain-containing protein n=1 Tax=Brassica carinata TaxID=52824 RepID=A0A8X7W258_BRACI|nr:hypothetical protein Bca52824_015656 [Brassica carinata]